MFEKIEAQVQDMGVRIQQSLANHNYLLGAKAALEGLLSSLKTEEPEVQAVVAEAAPVVEEVDPKIAPEAEAVAEVVAEV